MGLRDKKTTRKLTIQKETLRKLQLRTLSDDELRAAPGGMGTACCGMTGAPSHVGC
jgi:hypothetical protein